MQFYELIPQHDRQRSFYGKAIMCYDNGEVTLYSYNTPICKITEYGVFVKLWHGWSATTQRHINEFRIQHHLPKVNKKIWLDL